MPVAGRPEVAHGVEDVRLRGPARQRSARGVNDAEAGPHPFQIHVRRESDRAVAVQLERPGAGGRQQGRRQLAHGVRREQPAGILQIQPVHVRAVGERRGPLGVVVVGVDVADRIRQPDHDLLGALGPRHRCQPSQPLRIVRRLGDLDPANPVADAELEREPHHLLVRRHPGDEPHPGRDDAERGARHRGADEAQSLPRILAMEAHGHGHVRARGEVERVVADAVDRRRDREHVGRRQTRRAPQALIAVPHRRVDVPDVATHASARSSQSVVTFAAAKSGCPSTPRSRCGSSPRPRRRRRRARLAGSRSRHRGPARVRSALPGASRSTAVRPRPAGNACRRAARDAPAR